MNTDVRQAPEASEIRRLFASRKPVSGRVSIVIPVFQGERFILGAVASALKQTYHDIEIVVVNDGSTDGTAIKLAHISDPRVTVLEQANQGLSAARNLGLSRASGEYIAFLDADDRWFSDKLAVDVRALQSSADPVGIVYGWYYAVDDRGMLLNKSRPNRHGGHILETMIATDDFILPSATLFHHRVFASLGGFDVGSFHEDRVYFVRAAKRFPIVPTMRYLVVYRQSVDGLGRAALKNYEVAYRENLSIVEYLRTDLSEAQVQTLRVQQLRSLYYRFLMYGFADSAKRLSVHIDARSLRRGVKGQIAWLHARTGVNLMQPLRLTIQGANRMLKQRQWRRILSRDGLRLMYE